MAVLKSRRKQTVNFLQRDPGPWTQLTMTWLVVLFLIIVMGLVMLFSASYTTALLRHKDSYYFIRSQFLYALLGTGVMLLFTYIDYHWLRKMVWPGYTISILLLIVVLFCDPLNGCRRWLRRESWNLPTIQVSEVVKLEMILLTSHLVCKTPRMVKKRRFWKMNSLEKRAWLGHMLGREIMMPLLPLIPVLVLLFLEPHLSGMILMCAICGTILLLGGSGGWFTYAGAGIVIVGLEEVLKRVDSIPYLKSRLDGWTQDISAMTAQTRQSLYAIGSGGLLGVGLGNSVEKQIWLPECTNDFIFSVVCEEFGFVGAMVVLVLFIIFILLGMQIAFEAYDMYGTLICVGIIAQIAWQVFCNVAVVTNTLPNTGISLPFFSSGGSSLLLLMMEMGIMLNVSRQSARHRELERAARRARDLAEQAEEEAAREKMIFFPGADAAR